MNSTPILLILYFSWKAPLLQVKSFLTGGSYSPHANTSSMPGSRCRSIYFLPYSLLKSIRGFMADQPSSPYGVFWSISSVAVPLAILLQISYSLRALSCSFSSSRSSWSAARCWCWTSAFWMPGLLVYYGLIVLNPYPVSPCLTSVVSICRLDNSLRVARANDLLLCPIVAILLMISYWLLNSYFKMFKNLNIWIYQSSEF